MADEQAVTLSEVTAGGPLAFPVGSKTYYVAQPTCEEYDDAQYLYERAYAKAMADPDIKALKAEPCSDDERAMYEGLAALKEAQAGKLPEGATDERKALLDEAERLRAMAATRTAAEELAHDRARRVKDRWLALHLLCDAAGNRTYDPNGAADIARFGRFWMRTAKELEPVVWQVLRIVETAPFE